MDKKRAIQGFVQLILSQARTFEVEKEQTNCRHDECGSTNVLWAAVCVSMGGIAKYTKLI